MVGERVDAVEVDGDVVNVVPTQRLQRPRTTVVGERVDAVEVDGDAVNVVPTQRQQRPNSASRDGWSVLDHPSRPPADVSSGASHPTLFLVR